MALENQSALIDEISNKDSDLNANMKLSSDIIENSKKSGEAFQDLLKNGTTESNTRQANEVYRAIATSGFSALSRRSNRKNDAAVQATIDAQNTETERALASIEITTKKRNKLGRFVGLDDKTTSLIALYPQLVDQQGKLNTTILEQALAESDLAEADRARLQALLDNAKLAEESFGKLGDYIAGIFGSVSDEIVDSFVDTYSQIGTTFDNIADAGAFAMESLEESFSRMIESFTKDAIEMSILQPIVNELNETNKALGVQFAKGSISSDQLQEGIISSLGDFYGSVSSIQDDIFSAISSADKLAEAYGFKSAFDSKETGDQSKSLQSASTGAITQSITENTGSELLGRANALMLSNERIANSTQQIMDAAMKTMLIMSDIRTFTSVLPSIEENTRKTYESLA